MFELLLLIFVLSVCFTVWQYNRYRKEQYALRARYQKYKDELNSRIERIPK